MRRAFTSSVPLAQLAHPFTPKAGLAGVMLEITPLSMGDGAWFVGCVVGW